MSILQRIPLATNDDDPPDNDHPKDWEEQVDGNKDTTDGVSETRPLTPGASYIFLKSDLSSVARLEEFNQEKIAAGFFSEVYRVTHHETGKVLVLKKNVQLFNRPNVLHEIQLLNQVHHPNIIKFLGVCIAEGQIHALTEYINHGNLRQLICDDMTIFPWPVRLGLAQDIADGMSYLHRLKIVHRDLTSLNCLVRKLKGNDLCAIVSDLGLASKLPENPEEPMSIVGSPFWMAPECLHGKLYNETADIFSYGIILCEMIARITSDPEDLPRLANFGLDEDSFATIVRRGTTCPQSFLQLAINCCKMTPSTRPAFKNIVIKIENITTEYNSNNNDRTCDGYLTPKKSRSLSTVQPPRLSFLHNSAPRHRHHHKPKLKRCNSDKGPRPDLHASKPLNPFDTPDLQGGRVKLWDSNIDTRPVSHEFETIDDVNLLLMQAGKDVSLPVEVKRGRMKKRISQSLPSSPEMNRKIKQDEENTFAEEFEDQEFEDIFLQDGPIDLSQPRRTSLLLPRDSSLPPNWREDLKKPRSKSSDNFSKRLDSGLSSFGDEDNEIADAVNHLNLEEGKDVVFPPVMKSLP